MVKFVALMAAASSHGGGAACSTCHNGTKEKGKPANHISTTNACEKCHSTKGWKSAIRVDHTAVSGTCSSCHNGTIALGKPSAHIPTTANCNLCHVTNTWTGMAFNHSGVTATCSICHHTINACIKCHSTTTWSPATDVDHPKSRKSCKACH